MKSKLCILTESSWWDTDMTIIPHLTQYFDIEVHLVAEKSNNKFTIEEIDDFQLKNNVRVTIWQRKKRIRHLSNLFLFMKMFRSINVKHRNSLVNYVYMYDPYINFLFLLQPFKKLVSIHDYENHQGMDGFLRYHLKRTVLKMTNFFHFYSKTELDKFIVDYPTKRAFYTEMPLKDYGIPSEYSEELFSGKFTLLFFGYIRRYKGLDILLNAVNSIDKLNYELVIAGAAEDWTEYEESVKSNSKIKADIRFIDNNEIASFFSKADFLILPYRDATQSGPVLVALNYNIPVIASDLECFKKYIDDQIDGYLFEKDNVESLKATLNRALSLTKDQYLSLKYHQKNKVERYRERDRQLGEAYVSNIIG